MAFIETKNLKKYFKTPKGMLHAVDDVNISIEKGKTLGVVGESGSMARRCISCTARHRKP